MHTSKTLLLSIILPLLVAAFPQGLASTPLSTPAGPSPVSVPTQGLEMPPENHASINDFVSTFSTYIETEALDKRLALPAISGVIKYIPGAILPTIFNMADEMAKDLLGKREGDDDTTASPPGVVHSTVSARDELFTRNLDAALEARGLGSLASTVRSPKINLKSVLSWMPALIPSLIGPAFSIAQEIASHAGHPEQTSAVTSPIAPSMTAMPVHAQTTLSLITPSITKRALPTATAVPAAATLLAHRADAPDYTSLMTDIQSMIDADPGLLRVPEAPEQVIARVHALISPGLATAISAVG